MYSYLTNFYVSENSLKRNSTFNLFEFATHIRRLHVWTYVLKGQVLIVREVLMTIHTLTSRMSKRAHTTLAMQDLNAPRTHPPLSHLLVLVQEDPTITAPKELALQEWDQVAIAIHQQLLVIFLEAPDSDIFHIMSKWN